MTCREQWEERISELIRDSSSHSSTYSEHIGGFKVHIHPSVYSPKYFPETLWYGTSLPALVRGGSFLEIGVGLGLVSMHLAASGSTVVGVDINEFAVQITQQNFEVNNLAGTFFVSDIFGTVSGSYDFIFWNHPWQCHASIPDGLKTEKTFDEGYRLLKRFIHQAKNYLTDGGSVLLGTSCYADLDSMREIYEANGYSHTIVQRGMQSIGKGVSEEYYIVRLNSSRKQ